MRRGPAQGLVPVDHIPAGIRRHFCPGRRRLAGLAMRFIQEDDGAVTVDWVVLTAALVAIAIAVVATVRGGVGELGTEISETLTTLFPDPTD